MRVLGELPQHSLDRHRMTGLYLGVAAPFLRLCKDRTLRVRPSYFGWGRDLHPHLGSGDQPLRRLYSFRKLPHRPDFQKKWPDLAWCLLTPIPLSRFQGGLRFLGQSTASCQYHAWLGPTCRHPHLGLCWTLLYPSRGRACHPGGSLGFSYHPYPLRDTQPQHPRLALAGPTVRRRPVLSLLGRSDPKDQPAPSLFLKPSVSRAFAT